MATIPTPSLVAQATAILEAATSLQKQLEQHSLPQPSFEAATADGMRGRQDWQDAVDHPELLGARSALIDASQLMLNLALGPTAMLADLTGPAISRIDVLRTLDALGVAQAVPLPPPLKGDRGNDERDRSPGKEGETPCISIRDLAAKLGVVDPDLLHRHLRFAYLMGLFHEPRDGFVAHTAASAAMPSFSPWTQMRLGRLMSRGAWEVPGALRGEGRGRRSSGDGDSDGVTALPPLAATANKEKEALHLPLPPVSLADPQGRDFWQALEEDDPEGRGMEKFSASMKALLAGHTGNSFVPFVRGFDWAALVASASNSSNGQSDGVGGEDGGALVVDVGGGNGHVEASILGDVPPEIRFLIQDLGSNERAAHETIRNLGSEAEKARVAFQVHDFFRPQPPGVKPKPKAYILSRILHDWRDGDCVRILRGLVPAMEREHAAGGGGGGGAKLFVYERVLPDQFTAAGEAAGKGEVNIPNYVEQLMRAQDLLMFTLFGGGERSLEDWRDLFKAADGRLEIAAVRYSPLSPFANMEVVLL